MDGVANFVAGAALAAGGEAMNATAQAAGLQSDKGADYEALVAPVPEQMQAQAPGLELLMIPDTTTLVLQQKIEAAEVAATIFNMATGQSDAEGIGIETPNKYAVKMRDTGVLLYYIEEDSNDCMGYMSRENCRACMPYNFNVTSARTQQRIGRIESPWACDNCCCGLGCCCLLPIPVCCCLRSATWYQLDPANPDDETKKVPLAQLAESCTTESFGCARKWEIQAVGTQTPPMTMYVKPCGMGCMCCCDPPLNVLVDEQHPDQENPLARHWHKMWYDEYEPTNDRYPLLPEKEQSLGAAIMDAIKITLKEVFTDADTYLLEMPHDGPREKVGTIMGALLADMLTREE